MIFGGINYPGVKTEVNFFGFMFWGLDAVVITVMKTDTLDDGLYRFLVLGCLFLFVLPFYLYIEYSVRYRFTEKGIFRKKFGFKERFYPWDTVLEVSLKNPRGVTPTNRNCCTAICFTFNTASNSLYFKIRGLRKEFQVEYSPEAIAQVQAFCPLDILDKRKLIR